MTNTTIARPTSGGDSTSLPQRRGNLTKATNDLESLLSSLDEATQEHADAIAARDQVHARLEAGDDTVTGDEVVQADARVKAQEIALQGAERRASVKRTQVDALKQQVVIAEVREKYGDLDARGTVAAKVAAVGDALVELIETLRVYNAASDEAGALLEAAGVAERAEQDGVEYFWQRKMFGGPRESSSGYNVLIDGELVAWGASQSNGARKNHEDSLVKFALEDGLKRIGYLLGSNSSERGFRRRS